MTKIKKNEAVAKTFERSISFHGGSPSDGLRVVAAGFVIVGQEKKKIFKFSANRLWIGEASASLTITPPLDKLRINKPKKASPHWGKFDSGHKPEVKTKEQQTVISLLSWYLNISS